MSDKPYFDSREQSVSAPVLARTPAEEAERIVAIEALGEMVVLHGTDAVTRWALSTPPAPVMAPFVERFGYDKVRKWIGFHAWREPRYPTTSLRGQVLSQIKK